ncbi:DUF3110 domain-containing protein [Myxosarcina sp. GI1(2024)]
MRVYILLFNARTDNEGIHTIQIGDRNTILMFKQEDDALRYAGLLEAQDFPPPTVEAINSEEVEEFCRQSNYNWEIVDSEKLAVPPEKNVERTDWDERGSAGRKETNSDASSLAEDELERIRRQLEGLL